MKEFALFWRRRPTSTIWLAKVIYRWSYFCYLCCFTQNSIQQFEININVSHHYCYYCYPDLYTSHLYFLHRLKFPPENVQKYLMTHLKINIYHFELFWKGKKRRNNPFRIQTCAVYLSVCVCARELANVIMYVF